jgi:hypothetical protein
MHYFPVARARNWQRNRGRAGSCYLVTAALKVNGSVDRACVLAIADFMINPARAGTQTHMDLIEALPCEV